MREAAAVGVGPQGLGKSRAPRALRKADGKPQEARCVGRSVRSQKRKLSFKEQREFESLPAQIEALEEEQRRLTEESQAADFYKSGADHIRVVLARLEQLPSDLEAALARWLELEDRAGTRRPGH